MVLNDFVSFLAYKGVRVRDNFISSFYKWFVKNDFVGIFHYKVWLWRKPPRQFHQTIKNELMINKQQIKRKIWIFFIVILDNFLYNNIIKIILCREYGRKIY